MKRLEKDFYLLSLFIVIAFIFAAGLQKALLWFLFYLGLICIILTLIYYYRNWTLLDISRDYNIKKSDMVAGDDLVINLRIQLGGFLPWPTLEVEDMIPMSLTRQSKQSFLISKFWTYRGTILKFSYLLSNIPRGIHQWDTFQYRSRDPLNFINYRGTIKKNASLVVYPSTVNLSSLDFFQYNGKNISANRKLIESHKDDPVGIRDYQSGDRLSIIAWKSVAKTGHLQTKVFGSPLENVSFLVLDCSLNSWEKEYDPYFEEGVILAASLVKASIDRRIPMGFYSNFSGHGKLTTITTDSEYRSYLALLAAIKSNGKSDIKQFFYKAPFASASNIIFISSKKNEEIEKSLQRTSGKGSFINIILIGDYLGGGRTLYIKNTGFYKILYIKKADDLVQKTV